MKQATQAITETQIDYLPLLHRGKVRDIYALDSDYLLIIATDRLSAFDVVLPSPIPDKGAILAEIANFWFQKTQKIIANHCTTIDLREVLSPDDYALFKRHAVIVKKMDNLPIEGIVRGYLSGSGYKDYLKTGAVSGIKLPAGLQMAQQLAAPIFTPSTKAAVGDHDENVDFAYVVSLLGKDMATEIQNKALALYQFASDYAQKRDIIIADTKFEFGLDKAGNLHLIDEALTPDSSRFWDKNAYVVGTSPESYDKQIVRDYLETLDWDKTAPGPELPDTIIQQSKARYEAVRDKLLKP